MRNCNAMAEAIWCAGSPALAMRFGARMAEPGEFTRRAFLNGRIDLTEAEAVADLVEARSESALRQAISHLTGALAEKLGGLRRELISIRAHLEAEIDFSDEGIATPISWRDRIIYRAPLHRRCDPARQLCAWPTDARRCTSRDYRQTECREVEHPESAARDRPRNRDCDSGNYPRRHRRLDPGRTLSVGSPGYRREFARVSDEVEKIGIERSQRSLEDADLVLAVFDSSEPLTQKMLRLRITRRTGSAWRF